MSEESHTTILRTRAMTKRQTNGSAAAGQKGAGLPAWKRALDLAFVVTISPALLLLGGGVALVIICGSRGPVLFRQRRVGYQGREFTLFKFRTMYPDAETKSHEEHFQ